jgi:hypothetical protein
MNPPDQLTPDEREQILQEYAESCYARHADPIRFRQSELPCVSFEVYVTNCRAGAIKSIRNGKDTWERIYEVAAKDRKELQNQWS